MRGLEGNEAAQPRVFAHDAIPLNFSGASGTTYGFARRLSLTNTNAIDDVVPNEILTSSTNSVKIRVTSVTSEGKIGAWTIINPGQGNTAPSALTFTKNAKTTIFSVDEVGIPHTEGRGAVVYVGGKGTNGTICVKLEGGSEAVFQGCTAGSFLPILVTDILFKADDATGTQQTTDVTNVLALF